MRRAETGAAGGEADDHIFLTGVEIVACHGVLEEERSRPQRFVVDVDAWLDAEVYARTDDYRQAVCYAALLEAVADVVTGLHVSLIEALALSVADELLERFRPLHTVRITVHKPQAPLKGRFSDVGVSLTRRRLRQG